MLSRRSIVFAGASLAASATIARAQPAPSNAARACEQKDTIVAIADFLLTEPSAAPRFWRDRHGADAAYLRLRYGGERYADGVALLGRLATRSRAPERLLELHLAYARPADRAAMIAGLQPAAAVGSTLPETGASAWRAMIVEDGGEKLIAELARWRDANPDSYERQFTGRRLADAIADVDDAAKAVLAKRLEAAGLWSAASAVAERQSDLSDWLALQGRRPANLPPAGDRGILLRGPLNILRREPLDMAKQPAEIRQADQTRGSRFVVDPLYALVRRSPDSQFVLTVLNQQGDARIATDLAAGVVADMDRGKLDPLLRPDEIVKAFVDGLDRLIGREEREKQLRGFQIGNLAFGDDSAGAMVDAALARLALAPLVKGEVANVERPAALTAGFAWETWLRVANTLRIGTDASIADHRLIAAELLDAAGRWPEALAVLKAEPDWQAARRRAHRLMTTLDRRCGDHLSPPAPLQDTIYRFGPR